MKNNYVLKFHNAKTNSEESFVCDDINGLMPDLKEFLSIDSIIVDEDCRNKGIGSKVLIEICESNNDRLIILVSEPLVFKYPGEPIDEEYTEILNRLDRFIIKNNFITINDYVGYEYKKAYVYNNELGRKIRKKIDEVQEEMQAKITEERERKNKSA